MSTAPGPTSNGWRYYLLALLFAIVGITIVVVLFDKNILPIAGPFALLALLPLLIPLRARGLNGRKDRMVAAADEQLREVVDAVDTERSVAPGERPSQATEQSLANAAALAAGARQHFADHDDTAGMQAVNGLTALARQDWSGNAQLTKTVAKLERFASVHATMPKQLGH